MGKKIYVFGFWIAYLIMFIVGLYLKEHGHRELISNLAALLLVLPMAFVVIGHYMFGDGYGNPREW